MTRLLALLAFLLAGLLPAPAAAPGLLQALICKGVSFPPSLSTFAVFNMTTALTDLNTTNTRYSSQSQSPGCDNRAVEVRETTANSIHVAYASHTVAILNVPYQASMFVKRLSGTRNMGLFFYDNTASNGIDINVDPVACRVVTAVSAAGSVTTVSSRVEPYPNGWCKITTRGTFPAGGSRFDYGMQFYSGTSNSYTGVVTQSGLVYGLQVQLGNS